MADQEPKIDLKLRLHVLEAQMDNLVDRFEASNLLLHDLIARTEKMEVWCKQMQEDGRFVYDSDVQESASLDETVKPTQVLGDTVDKEDESVHGGVVEQTNIDEFEKEVQKSSNVVEQLEGILESELSSPSLEPTERRSREREDTTQGTGVLGHGSVKEREEFEDENREQEELRQLEKPDESDELVQDLAASSENKEDFGQGTEELREDSVELDTAKGSGTALSERVRLGEGAEEKGNYYESEELEVEGCNHEGRLAEEVDKQEEAVQSEAGNEEQTEHDYISEPVEWKVCIGGAKLESSEEMEKILPGEGGIQEELVQRKTEDEENKENIHELQLAGIEGCVREVSEHLEREMSEVAGKGVETAGTRIEGEEKIEDDYELVSIEMEECTEESVLDTSKQFERRLSEGEGIEEDVVQSNTENEEQEEENNVLQLTDIQIYMEEALLDTSERLERRCSEEADIRHDAEDSEENEHTCELEPAKVEECTEEARFDTSGGPYRRLCEEGGKEKEMAHCKTEGEEENLRDCKPDVAKLEECIEEASSTSEHSNRRLCEEAEKQEDVVKDEPQEGDEKEHYYETERTIVEECVEEGRFGTTEEMERRHSEERGKEEDVLQCKIEAEEETEIGYKSQPTKIDEGTEEAKLNTSEKFGSRLSDEAGNEQEVLGSKTQEGEKEQPDSELEMSAGKGCVIAVSLDTSEESETQLPVEIKKRDMIQNEIQETLRLITINVENKMDVTMPCTLRKSVGDCITKLVESSVTELNQKVLALEDKLTEQNRVNCRLKEEIRRLYRELTKTAEKSNSLKEQIKAFQEKANTEALKQKVYQTYALDLAGKCYDVSVSAEKGIMKCRRKYDILKSKYNARAKHEGECEKSDLLDTDMDELADEAMEREMALVLQCQRELKENFKTVFETPPMVQHFDVEKVKNTEALNKCRVEVLEDIQKSPLSQLKAMEAILTKEKREHDYVWKGVINKLKLSLHEIVGEDCPVLTNLLLEYGASRNAEDRKGNTPLHYAAKNGNVVVGRALVEAGAHVNTQNSRKMTPLHMALYHKHVYFSLMLLRSQTDVALMDISHNTALHLAALLGNAILLNRLTEKGADVNALDLEGDTPIFNAAIGGNEVTGKILVGAGADVSAINNDGSTPLHVAAWEGCNSFCVFLLNQGAPVDPMNSHNVTPLHLAAMEDHANIVQILITAGARVNCLEERTNSPLHYAAKFGNIPMMKTLLRAGANVLAINAQRRTPLHIAAAKGHTEACSLLINAKSDVNASDEKGRTPLHMVGMCGGSISVAEVLVKKGANVTAVDSNGLTCWDLGYTFKNVEFAAWLEEQIFARDGRREKGSVRKKGRQGKK